MKILASALEVEDLVKLFEALLQDKPVVCAASDPVTLSAVIHALKSMIAPCDWSHSCTFFTNRSRSASRKVLWKSVSTFE